MNKEFVPYEQALALKELEFNEPCFGYYTGDKMHLVIRPLMLRTNELESYVVTAPTFSQAFRWFREKYGYYSFVFKFDEGFGYETYKEGVTQTNESFDTYEEAELGCLKKLIEIVKNKTQKL